MAEQRASKNKFTHYNNSKVDTIEKRVEELLSEGIAVVGRSRKILVDEDLHLNEQDFKCYKDGIDVQVDMDEDERNSQNVLLEARGFNRYLIIPSNCDKDGIIEYYLKYTE